MSESLERFVYKADERHFGDPDGWLILDWDYPNYSIHDINEDWWIVSSYEEVLKLDDIPKRVNCQTWGFKQDCFRGWLLERCSSTYMQHYLCSAKYKELPDITFKLRSDWSGADIAEYFEKLFK